jgi:hypothetical protein
VGRFAFCGERVISGPSFLNQFCLEQTLDASRRLRLVWLAAEELPTHLGRQLRLRRLRVVDDVGQDGVLIAQPLGRDGGSAFARIEPEIEPGSDRT